MNTQQMVLQIIEKAKELGIDDNLFFVATFTDYQKKRRQIKDLAERIEKQGIVVNGNANTLLDSYDKSVKSAAFLAEKLMNMLGEKPQKKNQEIKEDKKNKMPDFEMCSPAQLKKWCKEFDIDPSDYSKQFLIRALEKRWKFKYE